MLDAVGGLVQAGVASAALLAPYRAPRTAGAWRGGAAYLGSLVALYAVLFVIARRGAAARC